MQIKRILVVVILAVFFAPSASLAQRQQGDRPQTDLPPDGRYLIYMRGIT